MGRRADSQPRAGHHAPGHLEPGQPGCLPARRPYPARRACQWHLDRASPTGGRWQTWWWPTMSTSPPSSKPWNRWPARMRDGYSFSLGTRAGAPASSKASSPKDRGSCCRPPQNTFSEMRTRLRPLEANDDRRRAQNSFSGNRSRQAFPREPAGQLTKVIRGIASSPRLLGLGANAHHDRRKIVAGGHGFNQVGSRARLGVVQHSAQLGRGRHPLG